MKPQPRSGQRLGSRRLAPSERRDRPLPSPGAPHQPTHGATGGPGHPADTVLYTAEQAAQMLQVRPSWLRRKAAARAIPCRYLGKHLRFTRTDVQAITDNSAHQPRRSRQ